MAENDIQGSVIDTERPYVAEAFRPERSEAFAKIHQKFGSLSKSEKRIAELLFENPQFFANSSVREVASRTDVSEPTVLRFCRNIGFDGFKDFKIRLTTELAVAQAKSDAQPADSENKYPLRVAQNTEDIIKTCLAGATEAVRNAARQLDVGALKKASEIIMASRRVVIFGLGGSSGILAHEISNRLIRFGINTLTINDSYQQRMISATLSKQDVCVLVSSTGRPQAIIDSIELSKYYGARCIGLLPQNSPANRGLDVCLNVELSQSGVQEQQPNPMRFAQLFVIDCLSFHVALRLGDPGLKKLRQARASVATLHSIVPQQPIGD